MLAGEFKFFLESLGNRLKKVNEIPSRRFVATVTEDEVSFSGSDEFGRDICLSLTNADLSPERKEFIAKKVARIKKMVLESQAPVFFVQAGKKA